MATIVVRSKDANDARRVVFDQADAGVKLGKPSRVVIRADGKAHDVNGSLKVVKDAIARGELVQLEPPPEALIAALDTKAEK